MRPPRSKQLGLLAATALLALTAAPSLAAVDKEGDLIATFDADLNPNVLPRKTAAPIAVRVAGNVRSASGDSTRVPQLRRIIVEINRGGRLFDRGLPICHANWIQPSKEEGARAVCGEMIVGDGHVTLQVRIPGQLPFKVRAKLLVFNGPRRNGDKLILAQAYAPDPPGSFIITFRVERQRGLYGTVLSTTLPVGTREWAYITHFDMTLRRVYTYNGQRRSYASAACPAPPGFKGVLFPFAHATYRFTEGQRLSFEETASCRVAQDSAAARNSSAEGIPITSPWKRLLVP